jgi:PII-like signaling protein
MIQNKFDLNQALYDALVNTTKENVEKHVAVFLEISQKTGISPEELDKIILGRVQDGGASVVQVYYSILGYMQSHKMDTNHIL